MYCIAILTDQEQEGQNCAEYIRNYCTVFWADTKNSTGSGVSCITWCVRAECGRTSPFPVSEMWDYLVQ